MLLTRISSSPFGTGTTRAAGVASRTLFYLSVDKVTLPRLHRGYGQGHGYATTAVTRSTKTQLPAFEDGSSNISSTVSSRSGIRKRSSRQKFATAIPDDSSLSASISPSPTPITKTPSTKPDRRNIIFHSWDPQMDALMIRLNRDYDINWRTIGRLIHRPYTTCYTRFLKTLRPALENGWTPPEIEDQALLEQLVQEAKTLAESKKSKATAASKNKEAPLTTGSKRATWDPATDQTIVKMVEAGKSWPEIGYALHRPYPSCYSRYYSALDPVLKEPWSPDVIRQIDAWVRQGVCWKTIAKELRMRPVSCKAKWMSLNKFDTFSEAGLSDLGLQDKPAEAMVATTDNNDSTNSKNKVRWIAFSKEESESILRLVEQHGSDNWDQVLEGFQASFLRSSPPGTKLSRQQQKANQRLHEVTASMLRHQHSRVVRDRLHWTLDQETVLIQQVLQHGTEGHWENIAQRVGCHSAEACRSHWKQLDMPTHSAPIKWNKTEQSTFWSLWQEFGSNFERLAKLCGGQHSAADCQRYFEDMTQEFPDPDRDPDAFQKKVEALRKVLPTVPQKFIFTKTRSLRLQRAMRYLRRHYGSTAVMKGAWNWIADRVQRGLPKTACMEHWMYLRMNMDVIYGPLEQGKTVIKPTFSSAWSHEELKLLDQGIRALGFSWIEIQRKFLPWRTTRSLRQRWLLMSDKSTQVTEEEYYTIVTAGDTSSEIDYDALARSMTGWNRSPCQRVFETTYKHLLATSVWLPEEDQLLIEKTLQVKGRDWEAIARHFDGVRTASAPLFTETMARIDPASSLPLRTHKTAWQCRLRWCQLMAPLIQTHPLPSSSGQQSLALKLSKQLLMNNDTATFTTKHTHNRSRKHD